MSDEKPFTAYEVAAAALLARYGTLDVEELTGAGADGAEIGAAINIGQADLDPERVKAAGAVASPLVRQHVQKRRAAES